MRVCDKCKYSLAVDKITFASDGSERDVCEPCKTALMEFLAKPSDDAAGKWEWKPYSEVRHFPEIPSLVQRNKEEKKRRGRPKKQ